MTDLESQLESHRRASDEVNRQLKRLHSQVTTLQVEAEESRTAREEALSALRELEKKARNNDSDKQLLQEQLDTAVAARRKAESELDALSEELGRLNAKGCVLFLTFAHSLNFFFQQHVSRRAPSLRAEGRVA